MKTGTQIVAPEGWKSLPKDMVFHLLWNDAANRRVWMVRFESGHGTCKANLFKLSRADFETGVHTGAVVPLDTQATLPPWLVELEGMDLSSIDARRSNPAKIPHKQRVEDRYLFIASAVNDFKDIMTSEDPQAELNRRARNSNPPQNETRFRLAFLTYVCFGRNIWALLPPFHRAGHWDRFEYAETKFGAPSKAYGKHYGGGCSQAMAKRCVESYRARARLGKSMKDIYTEATIEDFGYQVVGSDRGLNIYAAPEGETVITFQQFRYRVQLEIGLEAIHKGLYGVVRFRNKLASSKGRFSEEIANLMERVEFDGYYVKERPRGYLEGSTLPPLCVVTPRDLLSGAKLGIGFSFGKERGTAYSMALFSMAVPKDYFCELFGIRFKPGEWVNEGVPPHFAIDRGPGARSDLIKDLEQRFVIRDLAPSWSGQSKATVESAHPYDVKIEGQPTFIQSHLTPVEMARREIYRVLEFNNTANMEARLDPDSDMADVEPSPNGIWKYYDSLFRNDGQGMSIADAVRLFLTPTEFIVKEDGIYLHSRRFYDTELRETGLLDKAHGANETCVNGYVLDMCVRYVWLEIDGVILQVPAILRIRGDEESLYVSLAELKQWDEHRKTMASAFRVHQQATSSDIKYRFKEETGKDYHAGTRKPGKPKGGAQAQQEEKDVLHSGKRRGAA